MHGLYRIKNFCVTLDGRLLAPHGDKDAQSNIAPFYSMDEFNRYRITMGVSNPFLNHAEAFPVNLSSVVPTTTNNSSSLPLPPYLPGRVLVMLMDGHAATHNTGHMLHRIAALNKIRQDINPELMLVVADQKIPIENGIEEKQRARNILKSLFVSSCSEGSGNNSKGEGEGGGLCGLKRCALCAHHEMLGIPIATINVEDTGICRREHCFGDVRIQNRRFIRAASRSHEHPLHPHETPIEEAFMCFEEGYFYQNHRKGPVWTAKEDSPLFKDIVSFRAVRETNSNDTTNDNNKNSPSLEFKEKDVYVGGLTSVFDPVNATEEALNEYVPPNTSYIIPWINDTGGYNPFRYALGQRTLASFRKGRTLRDMQVRERELAATKPSILAEALGEGGVVINNIVESGVEVPEYPLERNKQTLNVMFSVRSGPRRIPYLPAIASHISKALPFLQFRFVEESTRGNIHNLLPRLAMETDIMIGVHGALLTNVVYLPTPPNMSFSDRGGVLVELSSNPFTVTQNPQGSTFGTWTASLGLPMAKINFWASTTTMTS